MKTTRTQKLLSLILCLALIAAMALMTVGCDGSSTETPETSGETTAETFTDTTVETAAETAAPSDITVKGNGATVFYFNVIDGEGNVTKFEIHTDKTIVGEALLEVGLIAGEDSQYGLFVKSVNGMTADYKVNGTWWEFMMGDKPSMTGVDLTNVEAGATYAFRVSK